MPERIEAPAHCYRIGAIVCDLTEGFIVIDDRQSRLEPRLCGVLALLIQHAPEPVTRDMFLDIVWAGEGSDEALTQSISRLRRLLGDNRAIRTHPRIGYSLAAVATEMPTRPAGLPVPSGWRARFAQPRWRAFAAAAVVLALMAGVWIWQARTAPAAGEVEFIELEVDRDFIPAPDR